MVERIRQGLTGKKILEAKDLYKEGLRDDGILVRSIGESMASYGTRRIRWARKLKELDSDYAFSEQVQADMMLEHSRLTEAQRQLILMDVGQTMEAEAVVNKLKEHHPRIQEQERQNKHHHHSSSSQSGHRAQKTHIQ